MHYEIDYAGDNSDRRALKDALDWCGAKRYMTLARLAKNPDVKEGFFFFACSFAGFEGKPVVAMWERYREGKR